MQNPLNPPAVVRSIEDDATEAEIVTAAAECVSDEKWFVGECAYRWTKRYANGRTDASFGELVGLSEDSVYRRRRVFETFADVRDQYPNLEKNWSHFLAALTWEDAPECLAWANENRASVREMIGWRRMQHGEDITKPDSAALRKPWDGEGGTEASDEGNTDGNSEGTTEGITRRETAVSEDGGDVDELDGSSPENDSPVVEDDDKPYAPFRGGRATPERSAAASDVDDERITKAAPTPGGNRPGRIDAASVAFRKSCGALRQNLDQFVEVARRDEEQRVELEGILEAALVKVRKP